MYHCFKHLKLTVYDKCTAYTVTPIIIRPPIVIFNIQNNFKNK